MSQVTSLIRSYATRGAYEQDAVHLAWLGYVVAGVVEVPAPPYWFALTGRLFGVEPRRLTVTYRDPGAHRAEQIMEGSDVATLRTAPRSATALDGPHSGGRG
jgi:hypothetical protein